jgi:hypothetical protein
MKRTEMTRRQILRLGTAASAYSLCSPSVNWAFGQPPDPGSAVKDVDHLIWGVRDLDEGIDLIRRQTGVTPIIGGVHPGRGTWNALTSLGDRRYLEILAPDPKQNLQDGTAVLLRGLRTPQIVGWAAGTSDIGAIAQRVQSAGIHNSGIIPGSRTKPDGSVLNWKTLAVKGHDGTVVPFVIQWGDSTVHPSEDSPQGCRLQAFRLEHPEADDMNRFLEIMGLEARVGRESKPKLTASLETPEGVIEL